MQTCLDDIHTNLLKTTAQLSVQKQVLLPFVLFDQKQWALLKCVHHPISLVLELPSPEVQNNTLMTCDSKSYKDYLSDFFQNLLAIVDRHQLLQRWLLQTYRLASPAVLIC